MMPFQHSTIGNQLSNHQGENCSVEDAEFVSWQLGNGSIMAM